MHGSPLVCTWGARIAARFVQSPRGSGQSSRRHPTASTSWAPQGGSPSPGQRQSRRRSARGGAEPYRDSSRKRPLGSMPIRPQSIRPLFEATSAPARARETIVLRNLAGASNTSSASCQPITPGSQRAETGRVPCGPAPVRRPLGPPHTLSFICGTSLVHLDQ